MQKTRIMCIYERNMPTVSGMMEGYRILFENTPIQYKFIQNVDVIEKDIDDADIVVLIRPHNFLTMQLASKARKCGCYIVFFIDDDILDLPSNIPNMPWRKRSIWKNLKQSDIIVSPNKYLIDKYKGYTLEKRGVVLNTVVSDADLEEISKKNDSHSIVKIVYAAGADHAEIFEKIILPILPILDNKYGKKISLTCVGVHPNIHSEDYTMKIKFQTSMSLQQYRNYMRTEKFDIGLAPLHNNQFTKCKYYNKYIEYTIVGTVGVYSNCEPYSFIIEDGVNGKMAENTNESWLASIESLFDIEMRNKCLRNAQIQLKNNFSADKIRTIFYEEIISKGLNKKTSKCNKVWWDKIVYKGYRILDRVYLAIFYIKTVGVHGMAKKIKCHIHENKNYK